MQIRKLNEEQLAVLFITNTYLNKLFDRDSKHNSCAVAGGYLHADRPAKDVDIMVDLGILAGSDNEEYDEAVKNVLQVAGFSMEENTSIEASGGNGYLLTCTHSVFKDLEVQFISTGGSLDNQINNHFPLSIQQLAWMPDGSLYKGNDYQDMEYSNSILVKPFATAAYINKYETYFPDFKFVAQVVTPF